MSSPTRRSARLPRRGCGAQHAHTLVHTRAAQNRNLEAKIQRTARKISQLKTQCKKREAKRGLRAGKRAGKRAGAKAAKGAKRAGRKLKRARKQLKKKGKKFQKWVVRRLADLSEGVHELDLAILAMAGKPAPNRTLA